MVQIRTVVQNSGKEFKSICSRRTSEKNSHEHHSVNTVNQITSNHITYNHLPVLGGVNEFLLEVLHHPHRELATAVIHRLVLRLSMKEEYVYKQVLRYNVKKWHCIAQQTLKKQTRLPKQQD